MKTIKMLALSAAVFLSLSAFAQTTAKKNAGAGTVITFSSQEEKDTKIKQLDAKIKVDQTDPTYPAADLAKEKQELATIKKAVIVKK